jgi:transcription elongation factor GreB
MARWRPPKPRSSPYITPEGEKALSAELKALWLQRRQEVVPALQAAAAEGDRSENAEYIYRRRQLAGIDRRVRYLSKRLDEVQVVHSKPPRSDRVFFGARVEVEDAAGGKNRYRIVGSDETDAAKGWISVDSPVARALLGKGVGDEVAIDLPDGRMEVEITTILYS